jgi:SOS-response transcriptional repressor LexA
MLTRRQRDLLGFITTEIEAGRRPTYRLMMHHGGYKSTAATFALVERLIDRGHLHRAGRRLFLGPRVMWMRFDEQTKGLVRHDLNARQTPAFMPGKDSASGAAGN